VPEVSGILSEPAQQLQSPHILFRKYFHKNSVRRASDNPKEQPLWVYIDWSSNVKEVEPFESPGAHLNVERCDQGWTSYTSEQQAEFLKKHKEAKYGCWNIPSGGWKNAQDVKMASSPSKRSRTPSKKLSSADEAEASASTVTKKSKITQTQMSKVELMEKISSLEKSNVQLTIENDYLQQETDKLTDRLCEAQMEAEQREHSYSDSLIVSHEKIETLQNETQNLNSQLTNMQNHIDCQTHELETKNNSIELLRNQLT